MSEEMQISRRKVLTGLGATIALAAVAPAVSFRKRYQRTVRDRHRAWKTRLPSIPDRPFKANRNPGRAWPAR